MRHLALAAIGLLFSAGCLPGAAAPPNAHAGEASGALIDALIWTGDPQHPWADAIAWKGERIVAVGTEAEVLPLLGVGMTPVDAHGTMAVPGFIDSHLHFIGGGAMLTSVRLQKVRSRDELVAAIAAYSHGVPPGAWITGGGWDQTRWGGELPDRSWIDEVTPDTPVWIERVDGHMALANTAALRAAGVTRDTLDVPGGTIVHDLTGEPNGIFKDNALALVGSAVPVATPTMNDRALAAAMSYVASNGVTSVTSMGSWDDLVTFQRARDKGTLRTRINAVVPLETWERLRDYVRQHGRGDAWVSVGGLKGFADGSLGARTASMLEPFSDALGGTGLVVTPTEELYARVKGADTAGLAVMIHAIGDRANQTVLDVYQRVANEDGARDRRFRIEHAQHLAADDLVRFGKLRVVASMQPYHCIDDGRWAEAVIGAERAKRSYAYRALLRGGAPLAFGSDWPVAPATPLEGIYAAVTRRTPAHPEGWIPAEKLTVEEALRAYTIGGAYAAFQERDKGTLEVGKLADITLLDSDITKVPPEALGDVQVVATIVGGRMVYPR